MAEYEQWLIYDDTLDISFTSVGQAVPIVTNADVDPTLWDIWETYYVSGVGLNVDHDWQPLWNIYEMHAAARPGGNNLPSMQVRWDSVGTWHTLDQYFDIVSGQGIEQGPGLPRPGTIAPRPTTPTTISFRGLNDNDPFGNWTPRTVIGVRIRLVASYFPTSPNWTYAKATFGAAMALNTGARSLVTTTRRMQTRGQIIG